ncbi:MAG: DUF4402 domain-containing protein [Gemmatimonadales bacterium]
MLVALALVLARAEAGGQVVAMRNLAFGTILSGTTTAVSKTSASSAQWRFTGTFPLGGTAFLTLPTTLTGPGPAIPITFSTTDGQYNTVNNPVGGTSFNPHNSQSVPALFNGTVYVWLGASMSPPANQTPGTYGGTVVLTVTGML